MSIQITKVEAIQILDSRGNPTIEARIFAIIQGSGERISASASVPSGASTGSKEAFELRDNDPKIFNGKSVFLAIKNINEVVNKKIFGMNFDSQESFDKQLIQIDGTENKSKIGANAILALSFAFSRLLSISKNEELFINISKKKNTRGFSMNTISIEDPYSGLEFKFPVPMMNIVNGGVHADNGLDIQEFMIMPVKGESFSEALMVGVHVYHELKKQLKSKHLSTNVGDEGGFAPNISSTQEAIELITSSIQNCGYVAGRDVLISLDCAASEFYDKETKMYSINGKKMHSDELITFYDNLIQKYPIFSIEDPMSEHDQNGFILMTSKIGKKVQIVGDDYFVTNPSLIKKGISENACNAVLIKPNQIGTLTETKEAIKISHLSNYATVMSHRSGETEDNIISQLSIGYGCEQIKFGAPCRSDRNAKYNELLRIEKYLQDMKIKYSYAGVDILNKFNKYRHE